MNAALIFLAKTSEGPDLDPKNWTQMCPVGSGGDDNNALGNGTYSFQPVSDGGDCINPPFTAIKLAGVYVGIYVTSGKFIGTVS
ncbi:hypothetical protein BHL54_27870 [Bacillus cereus]|nr:hypothetical protein BHL54_27870 [Bacillus cereus]